MGVKVPKNKTELKSVSVVDTHGEHIKIRNIGNLDVEGSEGERQSHDFFEMKAHENCDSS